MKDSSLIKSAVLESITKEFCDKGIKFDDNKLDLHLDQQTSQVKPAEQNEVMIPR